jgi:hypothetical protein
LYRFRGENAHAHEVDVIVQVAESEISANGRFASGGKVKMGKLYDVDNQVRTLI